MTTSDRLIACRVQMQKRFPFFAYLSMYMNFKESTSVPTMGVDSEGNIYYSSDFIQHLNKKELEGVLIHETLHCALMHFSRLHKRNRLLSNIAQDLVVNDMLTENQIELPKGALLPSRHQWKVFNTSHVIKDINTKTWEQIYDELIKLKLKSIKYQFDIHLVTNKEGKSDEEEEQNKISQQAAKDWAKRLVEAYTYSKLQGITPLGMDRLIDKLHFPTVSWRYLLQKYIQQEIPFDFSYLRPSKKSIVIGTYLPSVLRENLSIVIGVDSSGSISQELLEDFLSEILGILRDFPQVDATVLICDAEIQSVQTLSYGSDLTKLELKGGGGTDFRPVFEWVRLNKPHCQLILYLTDLQGTFPKESSIPTIWCYPKGEDSEVPFGVKIMIDKQSN